MKILVMGLPGSGKTVFARRLADVLDCPRLNNDEVRKAADDWDFSDGGRLRQCIRMKEMAEAVDSKIVYGKADTEIQIKPLSHRGGFITKFVPNLIIYMI